MSTCLKYKEREKGCQVNNIYGESKVQLSQTLTPVYALAKTATHNCRSKILFPNPLMPTNYFLMLS